MKVLMFGWEFPPHISGGLGTACLGLTESLAKEKVEVFFVVPRLYGDEPDNGIRLINASAAFSCTIPAATSRQEEMPEATPDLLPAPPRGVAPSRANRMRVEFTTPRPPSVHRINVPAGLDPYHVHREGGKFETITRWNYVFPHVLSQRLEKESPPASGSFLPGEQQEVSPNASADRAEDVPYVFSGAYGANLLDEVQRYAEVAEKIAREFPADIIHVHDWMTFPAGVAAKKVTGKPLVVHVHSTEFDRSGEHINRGIAGIEAGGMQAADLVVTVSNWTREIVMTRYHIPGDRVRVVHNGITPKEKVAAFLFPELGSHVVTFLGRITHQKGPAYFVEAAAAVLREFPDAHFIMAGSGDLLPQIIERVAQLKMSANFHFTGFIKGPQVDKIWSLTDVYVMPSVSEPFGIAPLEAIQGGVPVILSNQSGVSEVMPHAIKVDFWNTRSLAAAICSVLRYESLSAELRQNSKRHIGELTWGKAAVDLKVIYHDLMRP